ncbi:MAG: transketolase family protein [Lachnospiraceae bacterium]|nr:transketolase family protein [Lachnospiraceae bacterium]
MGKSIRIAYGEALNEIAEYNDKLVVCDADLGHATMTNIFAEKHPDRFFNFGIAECNLVAEATGMAHAGLVPFVSTFALLGAGRAYEIIRNSVCYVNANVKFALTHSGLCVGEDGGSHQAIEDLALMRVLPHMTILVPCDYEQTKKCVKAAAEIDGPVYIRVARPVVDEITTAETPFEVGKAQVMKDGTDVCLMATGLMVGTALKAAEMLEAEGISCAVINHHTIKPLDAEIVRKYHEKCKGIVACEEHSIYGGLGSAIAEVIAGVPGGKFAQVGVMDKFGKSGTPDALFEAYGLTAEHMVEEAKKFL